VLTVRHYCAHCRVYVREDALRIVTVGRTEVAACPTCGTVVTRETSRTVASSDRRLSSALSFPFTRAALPWTAGVAFVVAVLSLVPRAGAFAESVALAAGFVLLRSVARGRAAPSNVEASDLGDAPGFAFLRPLLGFVFALVVSFGAAFGLALAGVDRWAVGLAAAVGFAIFPAMLVTVAFGDGARLAQIVGAAQIVRRIPGPYFKLVALLLGVWGVAYALARVLTGDDPSVMGLLWARQVGLYAVLVSAHLLGALVRDYEDELS